MPLLEHQRDGIQRPNALAPPHPWVLSHRDRRYQAILESRFGVSVWEEGTRKRSLGLGDDIRLDRAGIEGCALACEGLVHLTAFPA
jgi:hypothetical protein